MGQVTLVLNGRSYRLACRAGEEERLRHLAAHVQEKIDKLVAEFGQVGDPRLLLMSALMIADEFLDARAERDQALEATAQALDTLAMGHGKSPAAGASPARGETGKLSAGQPSAGKAKG